MAFCRDVRARELILTHFSQRYKRPGDSLEPGETTIDRLVEEAKDSIREQPEGEICGLATSVSGSEDFICTVSAADDFKTYTLSARN